MSGELAGRARAHDAAGEGRPQRSGADQHAKGKGIRVPVTHKQTHTELFFSFLFDCHSFPILLHSLSLKRHP